MITPIKVKIRLSGERGFMHDSRKDVRLLGEAINVLIDKVNELVKENNKLKAIIEKEKAA